MFCFCDEMIIFFNYINYFFKNKFPYCIPKKIIKHDGDEFKVKMLNWKIAPCVPSDYVIEHWPHIYCDYINSEQNDN